LIHDKEMLNTRVNTKFIVCKATVIVLVVLCFSCIGTLVYLDYVYQNLPQEQQAVLGRIYPMWVHHGTLVYLTLGEKRAMEYLRLLCPIFGFAAFALNLRWRVIRTDRKTLTPRFY
jgi:hypothetical protein